MCVKVEGSRQEDTEEPDSAQSDNLGERSRTNQKTLRAAERILIDSQRCADGGPGTNNRTSSVSRLEVTRDTLLDEGDHKRGLLKRMDDEPISPLTADGDIATQASREAMTKVETSKPPMRERQSGVQCKTRVSAAKL